MTLHMNTNPLKSITYVSFAILAIINFTSCTQNWPQFRGPGSTMLADGKDLPLKWASDTNVVWQYKLPGPNWSSPVIWGDKVFLTSALLEKSDSARAAEAVQQAVQSQTPAGQELRPGGNPPAGQNPPQGARQNPPMGAGQNPPPGAGQGAPGQGQNPPPAPGMNPPAPGQNPPPGQSPPENENYKKEIYQWEVICLNLNSGKELWRKEVMKGHPHVSSHQGNGYASETPVTDGKRIYALFGMTGLFCFDMDGNILWQKDLGAFKTLNGWGTGSSPAVYKDVVYIQADNEESSFIIALDAATGQEKWKATRDEKTTYSTPFIWINSKRTELVTTGKTARSFDPATGKVLWEIKMGGEMAILSPVATKDQIYIGIAGGRDKPGALFSIKAGAEGDISPKDSTLTGPFIQWAKNTNGIGNASPLLYQGNIYLLTNRGGKISCYSANDGKVVYEDVKIEGAAGFWATPWASNGKIYCLDEKGKTFIVKAGNQFAVEGQNKLNDKFWASVAITKKGYLFKGAEGIYYVSK